MLYRQQKLDYGYREDLTSAAWFTWIFHPMSCGIHLGAKTQCFEENTRDTSLSINDSFKLDFVPRTDCSQSEPTVPQLITAVIQMLLWQQHKPGSTWKMCSLSPTIQGLINFSPRRRLTFNSVYGTSATSLHECVRKRERSDMDILCADDKKQLISRLKCGWLPSVRISAGSARRIPSLLLLLLFSWET